MEHKAFVNDKPIRFVQTWDAAHQELPPGFQALSSSNYPVERAAKDLERKAAWKGVIYLCEDPDQAWKEFVSCFVLIEAAGGLVTDATGRYLMIYRRKKWDLPKGKIDFDESPEEAAKREVEEECGIAGLKIRKKLESTFHTYPQDGHRVLKKTHWFLMNSDDDSGPVPQSEEDIEKAEWMSEEQIRTTVMRNTFLSVRQLLEDYFADPQRTR